MVEKLTRLVCLTGAEKSLSLGVVDFRIADNSEVRLDVIASGERVERILYTKETRVEVSVPELGVLARTCYDPLCGLVEELPYLVAEVDDLLVVRVHRIAGGCLGVGNLALKEEHSLAGVHACVAVLRPALVSGIFLEFL